MSESVAFLRNLPWICILTRGHERLRASADLRVRKLGGDLQSGFLVHTVDMLIEESKVASTHLWNTPRRIYQQAIMGFLS